MIASIVTVSGTPLTKSRMRLDPGPAHLRAGIDDDEVDEPLGMADREGQRVDRAQRHAGEDELVEAEMVDKPLGVGELGAHRIVGVVRPIAVAVAALVEREAVVVVAQRQADEVPGMRVQRAAMQKHDRRQVLVAPVEIVKPHPAEVKFVALRQHRHSSKLNPARTEVASRCSRYSSGDRLMAKTGSYGDLLQGLAGYCAPGLRAKCFPHRGRTR